MSYQAVFRACIKEAAAQGAGLMQATLARALHDMPAAAARSGDVVERNLLAGAAEVLREQQLALVETFPQALLAEFSQAIAGDRASSLSFESLPLLGEEQLQDNVQVVRAVRELQEAVDTPFREVVRLLEAADAGTPGDARRHPLRPEVYVRALHRLTRQSPVAGSVRRRWLAHLSQAMAPELARAYDALAALLRAQGVTAPEPGIAPPPVLPPAAADAQGADRATQLTIRELQALLAGDAPAAGNASRPDFAATTFSATVPAAFEVLREMRKVDQVMQQLRQRQAALPGSMADTRAAFRAALRAQVRRPAQALGLEVVHLMVENLAGDERLLAPVRDLVRELEPALLRLALADPRFFSDHAHPARQLLEEVTQRSLAWSSVDEPGARDFIEGLQQAVEVLLETRAAGPEAFDVALSTLQEAWADAQPRGRRNREKAVRALMRAEQRNLLAERIAQQVRERQDAQGAPADALAFLTGPWAQVLAQSRLSDSSGAEDPSGYGWVVQAVLWSVQPALAGRVATQHRELVERIQSGLASIDHLPAETQRWQNVLAELRLAAAAAALGRPPIALAPPPVPSQVETWLAPLEIYDSGFVPQQEFEATGDAAEEGPLPPLDLQPGSWVDVHGEGWERWQLTWSSPHGMLFMFTHAGGTTRSMTRRKVHQMLADGTLRLVSAQAVIDGALDAVARAAWRNSV